MTSKEFMQIVAYIESGTGHRFDEMKLEVWFDVLGDIPADSVKAAARRCLQEFEGGWPQPATIRRMAIEFGQGVIDGADQAWERVVSAVRSFGSYQPQEGMKSLDELTQSAVRACGGFLWACEINPANRQILASQFRKAYEAAAERKQRGRQLTDDVKPALPSPEAKKLADALPGIEERKDAK